MTSTDAALIERIGAGDPSALGELMAQHAAPLMRYAAHFLRSADEADEVLQDVFLRAERAIRRGTRPEKLSAWLFRITVNRCRSRRRRWWPFIGGEVGELVIARTATQGRADDVEWREEIAAALALLSPPLREAFLLKHVEGLTYEEMATLTGVSIPALKMRVARACDRLRARLTEVWQ